MDAATTAARAGTDDDDLCLLNPVVERAGKAIVERHRRRCPGREGQSCGGGSEQNSAHQSAAINLVHRFTPRDGMPVEPLKPARLPNMP
jgi:hypothetical protein